MTAHGANDEAAELSVVVLAYDEADNIGAVVENASAYLRELGVSHELLVVDDGSRDGTAAVLADLSLRVPELRSVVHKTNQGYGCAIRSGLRAARGRYVLLSDGDGQFRIDDLDALWPYRHRANVVLGYRNPRNDPFARRLAGWLYNRLFVRLMLGGRFRDVNCGFKLLARNIVADMELHSTGALISAELLTRARLDGATFVEVGVRHFPRLHGSATGLLPRVVLRMLSESVRLRRRILATATKRPAGLRPDRDSVESASV